MKLKNGKTSVNAKVPSFLRQCRLVDAAVAEADVLRLLADSRLARIREAVAVDVIEHAPFIVAEPAEHWHVAHRIGRCIGRNFDC